MKEYIVHFRAVLSGTEIIDADTPEEAREIAEHEAKEAGYEALQDYPGCTADFEILYVEERA